MLQPGTIQCLTPERRQSNPFVRVDGHGSMRLGDEDVFVFFVGLFVCLFVCLVV